ncbi:MAG: DTW domain-containing protein [Planctomycetia bacterium]
MGRSVVRAGATRCPGCRLPPRWCVCGHIPPVATNLRVHVLIHRHEHDKPSSTGRLVTRVVAAAVCHVYQRANRFLPASGFPPRRPEPAGELWILHPTGAPLPERVPAGALAPDLLLLDGTWRQAGEMLRSVEGLGRCYRLPEAAAEPSRFWLRDQSGPDRLSTAESLAAAFTSLGDDEAARRLRLHFELHVYVTLLARGRRDMAERYLGLSPLLHEATGVLDHIHARHGTGHSAP